MPFRKDHLQLVTDAGATLDIGWAYGTPYSLDPINGVDVDVQTAQGVNQVGVSVERQSVAGVSRELIIHCHSSHGDADAELLLEKLPYFTSGTMYFEDKYLSLCAFQDPLHKEHPPLPGAGLHALLPETLLVRPDRPELLHQRLCAQLQAAHQLQHTPPFRRAHLHRLAECL